MPLTATVTPGHQARTAAADADRKPLIGGDESSALLGGGRTALYQGRMTTYVLVVAVVASCSGYLFGYDIVSGVRRGGRGAPGAAGAR